MIKKEKNDDDKIENKITFMKSDENKEKKITYFKDDAIVFIHEKIHARENEIVIEFREILINMIIVWEKISLESSWLIEK